MFKSRKRNPNRKGRKQEDTEEEDKGADKPDDDNEDSSTAATIARVKKKRKLLTELQYKKGTDVTQLLNRRSHDIDGEDDHDDTTLHENTLAAEAIMASSSQEGIMEQKHKQALEEYVKAKLADMVGGDAKAAVAAQANDIIAASAGKNLTKEELYRQLAEASESMVGRKTSHSEGGGAHADGGEDGDVGTGGAMLVAGTGLAEVILPVEERLKAVHATQEANSNATTVGPSQRHHPKTNQYGMPHNTQVPVPSGTSRFQVSAADRHKHFAPPHQNHHNNHNNNSSGAPLSSNTEQPSNEVDQGRVGFEAARGKATTTITDNNNSNHHQNNNNNNQHGGTNNNGRKDYKNKASDDKVYGNFLKHHRENQWRGR